MALELFPPLSWQPSYRPPLRYPILAPEVLRELEALAPGRWYKVLKIGQDGGEVQFLEHETGQVTCVRYRAP